MSPEQLLGELEGERAVVIGDLEAGTGTLLRLHPAMVDVAVAVAQPTRKSLAVAARALRIAVARGIRVVVVANRVRDEEDVATVRAALDGHDVVVVPDDPEIARADEEGLAPLDTAPGSPGTQAIVALAGRLTGRRARRPSARPAGVSGVRRGRCRRGACGR